MFRMGTPDTMLALELTPRPTKDQQVSHSSSRASICCCRMLTVLAAAEAAAFFLPPAPAVCGTWPGFLPCCWALMARTRFTPQALHRVLGPYGPSRHCGVRVVPHCMHALILPVPGSVCCWYCLGWRGPRGAAPKAKGGSPVCCSRSL
jgi:hypothetical protein